MSRHPARIASGLLALVLAACGTGTVSPSPDASTAPSEASAASSPSHGPESGAVEPAPGSDSGVYAPNPGAIVVAIDPGHGGCLDWGVPDPSDRGPELAEKTLTLAIAQRLRDLLVDEGIGVLMIRDADEALAGDDYPPLNCEGPPFRDVNGDGVAGFGPDVPEATRTRDELQARLDLANLVGADALLSIHINSPSEGGEQVEIAFSETFYTDETPWGVDQTARLAAAIQAGVVARLDTVADYDRGDRGITAHNFFMVAPTLFEPTDERPDPFKQPTRGGLMPVVLSEVGSITLRSEHDLLASPDGQQAVAEGLLDGIASFFAERELAARIGLADEPVGQAPQPVAGRRPDRLGAGRSRRTARLAPDQHRHRRVAAGHRAGGGLDRIGPAVPGEGARRARAARAGDSRARPRRVGRRFRGVAATTTRRSRVGMDLAGG